ncbi:MAG TPA: Ig-like domain-containing protein [Gemmatimonadales bacterium]|nr:Ig-like domain-containing protein [Gemmatimonadales bacterium]
MKPYLFALPLIASASLTCVNVSGTGQQFLIIGPVLDSVFVGDTLAPRTVYILDSDGSRHPPGHISWSVSPPTVATIDSTGKVAGIGKGTAVVVATVGTAQSGAVVIVSRQNDISLLLDSVFVMPGDTITIPRAIKQKTPGPYTLTFDSSSVPSVITIDTLSGLVTAHGTGGPIRYRARLTSGTTTVSESSFVVVLTLTDTTETGRFFMTVLGSAIRHQGGGAFARNYVRLNGKLAFQLRDTMTVLPTLDEKIVITLPDSVIATGTSEIDSISPAQATTTVNQLSPVCQPRFPWALWVSEHSIGSGAPPDTVLAYSHGTSTSAVAGQLIITQYRPAVGGGAIISGRYEFTAQRRDLYDDPLGAEVIRGTFVAPVITDQTGCGG